MRCLEVAVNGERYCVAGSDQVPMLSASVRHGGPHDTTDRQTTSLTVRGHSDDFATDYYWRAKTFALAVGDIVTVRVVNEPTADSPISIPSPRSPDLVKLGELRKTIKQKRSAQERSARPKRILDPDPAALADTLKTTVRSLVVWSALFVLGLALWFFASTYHR